MPLIVITGFPSSGKTTRAQELKKHFEDAGKEVHVVTEEEKIINAGFTKDAVYEDSSKEKHIRGLLKSEVMKLVSSKNVVILDGLNYIKGYRYELYCASKANSSTQCTIYTGIHKDKAWDFNLTRDDQYKNTTFEALIMRYEEPDQRNRWDSPLYTILPNQNLDLQSISDCLINKKAPPPNMSTQNAPLSSTNFLYDLNRITKDISSKLITYITVGTKGTVQIPGYDHLSIDVSNVDVQKIIILTRQYIMYSKTHTPNIDSVPLLYIQYLKSNLNQ